MSEATLEVPTQHVYLPDLRATDGVGAHYEAHQKVLADIVADEILPTWSKYYSYNALLPELVGYVPEEEREHFSNFDFGVEIGAEARHWNRGAGGYMLTQGLREKLPGLYEIIFRDVQRLGYRMVSAEAELERKFTEAGKKPRASGFHTDIFAGYVQPNHPHVYYLLADKDTTVQYEGPARILKHKMNTRSIDPLPHPDQPLAIGTPTGEVGRTVSGPDFGVVRMHTLNVHDSPEFREDATRAFGRIRVQVVPLDATLIS